MCQDSRSGSTESLKYFQKLPTYVSFVNINMYFCLCIWGHMYRAWEYSQLQIGWHRILRIFPKTTHAGLFCQYLSVSFLNIYVSFVIVMEYVHRVSEYSQLQIGWHGILKIFPKTTHVRLFRQYLQISFVNVHGVYVSCGGILPIADRVAWNERWGAGVETQKNVRGEIGGWGRVPFNETYAPSLSTIYDGAQVS